MENISAIEPKRFRGFSGTALKRIACGSMLLDHIGASCLEGRPLYDLMNTPHWITYLPGLSPQLRALCYLDIVLRLIGRLAFPIYCFLLVEGFLHTHNVKRYVLRLCAFAAISEVPFDFAFFRNGFFPAYQNVFFTLLLGLLCLVWLQFIQKKSGLQYRLLQILGIAVCGGAAALLQTDYGFFGVFLIAALYLLYDKPIWQTICGCVLTISEITAPLAFFFLHFYNGERGRCSRIEQYAFYAFYPVHLSILACITIFLLR